MSSNGYHDGKGGNPAIQGQWTQVIQPKHEKPMTPADYSALPEVAYDRNALPEATPDSQYPSDATKYPVFEQAGLESRGYLPPPPEFDTAKKTRYCCGMTTTSFWICLLVVVLILAGAIGGGVAGGLKKNNHHPVSPTSPTQQPLSGSKLAALNWTDENSIERRAVFYQLHGALFVSQALGQDKTWTHLNISAQFVQYKGDLALNPRNGTPLAAAATPWQAGKYAPWDGSAFAITLFYFNEANQVRQLWTSVGDLSKWQQGGNFSEVATIASPSAKSQLSATGYYCGHGCINTMCIAFQGQDNSVQCSCSQTGNPATVTTAAFTSSPLMLLPLAADNGGNITHDSELLMLFLDNSNVGALVYNHGDDGSWDTSPYTGLMHPLAQVNGTLPQVVASTSDALANILAVAMTADGNFTASWWRGTTQGWTESRLLSFSNQNGTSFSSRPDIGIPVIAMNQDHRLYGITADGTEVVEYEWLSSNPYSFTWASRIDATQILGR